MGTDRQAPAILGTEEGLLVGVRVSPSAPRTVLRGLYGERMKISLSAPPEDNRANAELMRSLAGWLGLAKEQVRLHSGHTSRDKVVAFTGLDEGELREKLNGLLQEGRTADRRASGKGAGGKGRHGS